MTTTTNGNGYGKRWYDEHIKVVAFGIVLSSLVLLSPLIIYLFNRIEQNEAEIARFRLSATETHTMFVKTDTYTRDMQRVLDVLDDIKRDIHIHMGGSSAVEKKK